MNLVYVHFNGFKVNSSLFYSSHQSKINCIINYLNHTNDKEHLAVNSLKELLSMYPLEAKCYEMKGWADKLRYNNLEDLQDKFVHRKTCKMSHSEDIKFFLDLKESNFEKEMDDLNRALLESINVSNVHVDDVDFEGNNNNSFSGSSSSSSTS